MIRCVLFDLDGTLVNTNDVIIASWQYTYRRFLGHEAPVAHITACFGEPLLTTMAREFPMVEPETAAEIYRDYQQAHTEHLLKPFPGIDELLQALQKDGFSMGIVTSRVRDSTLRYLRRVGIDAYFPDESIVTCEDTEAHKPDPAPARLALARLAASPAEAVLVGDSPFDMKCARNAGVKAVLVEWRVTKASDPDGEAGADALIRTPAELLPLLRTWNEA